MKSEEVTDDQVSVLCTKVGIAPFADFGVWKPFGQRHAKNAQVYVSFSRPHRSLAVQRNPRTRLLCNVGSMLARSGQQPSCATSQFLLDRCASRFKERVDRFSDAWHLCVLADTRCRSELWESEYRRHSQFHESIQRSQHLFPAAHGTVLFVPRRTTAISGKRSWKIRWRISETCVKS